MWNLTPATQPTNPSTDGRPAALSGYVPSVSAERSRWPLGPSEPLTYIPKRHV